MASEAKNTTTCDTSSARAKRRSGVVTRDVAIGSVTHKSFGAVLGEARDAEVLADRYQRALESCPHSWCAARSASAWSRVPAAATGRGLNDHPLRTRSSVPEAL